MAICVGLDHAGPQRGPRERKPDQRSEPASKTLHAAVLMRGARQS